MYWKFAPQFAHLTGEQARKCAHSLRGQEDYTCAGFGSAWMAMLAVLTAKFDRGSSFSRILQLTGDSYLLEYYDAAPGGGGSKGGDATNKLGMQLMMVRDWIAGTTAWTGYIENFVDEESGQFLSKSAEASWRNTAKEAAHALRVELKLRGGI